MKAVVLAAGVGSRLGALTDALPKPMLPVAGRPIIAHLLERLAGVGVEQVFMNLHHRPDALRDYCGDGARWGLYITYAVEPTLLGTAGAVRNFGAHLSDGPFYVACGDNYLECDPSALLAFHATHGGLATLALFERDDVSGSGIALLDAAGRILRFVEKPPPEQVFSRLVNGGLYVLSPEILPRLPERVPCDFSHDVFPALAPTGALYGRVMEGGVWGIDTPELYHALRARLEAGLHAS
jgi:NDP-sugar pyrophosphorylase family protein